MSDRNIFLSITDNNQLLLDKLTSNKKYNFHICVLDETYQNLDNQSIDLDLMRKRDSQIYLYVITPGMRDYELIPFLIDDSNKFPDKTLFYFTESSGENEFNAHQIKSIKAIGAMVEKNGGTWCKTDEELQSRISGNTKEGSTDVISEKSTKRKQSKDIRVFLGGTVNGSTWRESMIEKLNVDFYNPVVKEWNEEAQKREVYERINCDYNLYIITPLMVGYYSLAEVVDDSFKKPGQTLYCFLNSDVDLSDGDSNEIRFTGSQLGSLRTIGNVVENNGGIWCNSLNEVITFFNKVRENSNYYQTYTSILESAVAWNRSNRQIKDLLKGFDLANANSWMHNNESADVLPPSRLMKEYFDLSIDEDQNTIRDSIFISYSRAASLSYAERLFTELSDHDHNVWFDKKKIRTGVDFRDEIQVGIENAGNFIYLISPQACKSIYCQQELDMAKSFGKRIIPVLHRLVDDHVVDPGISSFHREEFNQQKIDDPQEEERILKNIIKTIKSGNQTVKDHTDILTKALAWEAASKTPTLLLTSTAQVNAHQWLVHCSQNDVPIKATELQCEFICESKKLADNLFVDFWISSTIRDDRARHLADVIHSKGLTTNRKDPSSNISNEVEIIKSTRFIFIVSPATINDKSCLNELSIARNYQVPVIPLVLERIDVDEVLTQQEMSRLVDVSKSDNNDNLTNGFNDFLKGELTEANLYYTKLKFVRHKYYTWQKSSDNQPFLIRGKSLEEYENWLETYKSHDYVINEELSKYLNACKNSKELSTSDIFISYHNELEHFAFRLNEQLNEYGRVTWNDHTDQTTSARSEKFSQEGIEVSENIIIIISSHYFDSPETEFERTTISKIGKRVILIKEDAALEIPADYENFTCIDFTQDFELACTKLLNELQTDHSYVKKYNEISILSHSWIKADKSSTKLLLGEDLVAGKAWLRESDTKSPGATSNQREFILASEKADQNRIYNAKWRNRILVFLTILAVIATIYSFYEQDRAEKNALEAQEQRKIAEDNAVIAENNAAEAEKQKENAKQNAEKAKKSAAIAVSAQREAEHNAFRAKLKELDAKVQKNIAKKQAQNARKQEQNALNEKKNAQRSDSTARVLQQIETGKGMALSTSKLLVSDPDSAKLIALLAYDTLEKYRNSTTNAILFESLTEVYEETTDPHGSLNILFEGQALIGMQQIGDLLYGISENGYFFIVDVLSGSHWTASESYFQNVSAFTIHSDQIALGNRYGQVNMISIDSLNVGGGISFTLNSINQVHNTNSNISFVRHLDYNGKPAILSAGFDGNLVLSVIEEQQIRELKTFDTGSSIMSVDVAPEVEMIALSAKHNSVYILKYGQFDEANTHKFPSFQQIPTGGLVSSIKFTKNNSSVILGMNSGALKMMSLNGSTIIDLEEIKEHKLSITCIDVLDRVIITGSRDGMIKLRYWDHALDNHPSQILTYSRHTDLSEISNVILNESDGIAISMDNRVVKSWLIDIDKLYQRINQKLIARNE